MILVHSVRRSCATFAAALLGLLSVTIGAARADAPSYLPFQGFLTDMAGAPVNGEVELRIRLYNTSTPTGDADEIVHEEVLNTTADKGHFTVYLGDEEPLDLKTFQDNEILFVGVKLSSDQDEMKPLFQLGSAPYAGFAQFCANAVQLDGQDSNKFLLKTDRIPWSSIEGAPTGGSMVTEAQVDAFVENNGYATVSQVPIHWMNAASERSTRITLSNTQFNHLWVPAVRPARNGACVVTMSAQVEGATTLGGLQGAVEDNGTIAPSVVPWGMLMPAGAPASLSFVWEVRANRSYRFGCSVLTETGSAFRCTTTYHCVLP